MSRSLEVRLTEYRDMLHGVANQLEGLGEQLGKPDALADGVRLYRLVADDLTKVIAGAELPTFMITGELP